MARRRSDTRARRRGGGGAGDCARWLRRLALACLALQAGAATAAEEPLYLYNYHGISERLATAGQLTLEQVPQLAEDGFELVINLAVADPERNAGEAFRVVQTGMAYTQIPVDWQQPTLADLQLFFDVMDARGERRTLVHCFANYRASAFTYLYRTLRLGVPEAQARADLDAIWTGELRAKYPLWVAFMRRARESGMALP